jgi:hypothetical protein
MGVAQAWAKHQKYRLTDKAPHPEPELRIGAKR